MLTPSAASARAATASPRYLPEIVYGGATYETAEAIARGLADEPVAPEALGERAMEAARRLADLRPEVFAATKHQLHRAALARVRAAEAADEAEIARIWTAPETLDAMRDYVARTLGK